MSLQVKDLKSGMKIIFTPTGAEFVLKTVTDKKVVWHVGAHKGGNGINKLRTASTSAKRFQEGIDEGAYKIAE